ncbi:hypothetical protein MLD38_018237 [Melastoma candidum]|uniref:Uncharacterized protein n=1 Tax=Melastoma candidum TaxID=119954 RepID=A0ACB9QT85_9MYRT|nr:hypothetical protein MLD38_018237 [Melastoma candidum]
MPSCGVKSMAGEAKTKPDRQAICECIKKALASIDYDPSLIPTLPKKCGISISFPPIDQNTDCSKAINQGMQH